VAVEIRVGVAVAVRVAVGDGTTVFVTVANMTTAGVRVGAGPHVASRKMPATRRPQPRERRIFISSSHFGGPAAPLGE
jgi:hypothetical protein